MLYRDAPIAKCSARTFHFCAAAPKEPRGHPVPSANASTLLRQTFANRRGQGTVSPRSWSLVLTVIGNGSDRGVNRLTLLEIVSHDADGVLMPR